MPNADMYIQKFMLTHKLIHIQSDQKHTGKPKALIKFVNFIKTSKLNIFIDTQFYNIKYKG